MERERETSANIYCRFLVTFQRELTISKMQMHSEIRINYIQNDCAEEGSGNYAMTETETETSTELTD